MAAPIVTWTEPDNDLSVVSKWSMGKIKAGTAAPERTILVWNNKGGTTAVSAMQDVQITTTDGAGDTLDAVADKWVKVRCISDGIDEAVASEIGGATTHTITAYNQQPGVISGQVNDGLVSNRENFAKLVLSCLPPLDVPAGLRSLKTRIIYYYT